LGEKLGFEPHVAALGEDRLHPVEPFLGRSQHHAGGHVQTDVLAGIVLDFLVELDRVFLQLGDVRIAIDGVHAAGRVPGGAGCEFRTLQKRHIGPAEFRQVIKDRTTDDAAADNDDPGMAFHGYSPVSGSLAKSIPIS
jgi:hypothetical protein